MYSKLIIKTLYYHKLVSVTSNSNEKKVMNYYDY